jgi:hypothetical protein
MNSRYNQVTLAPTISHLFHANSGGADVLFDWQPIEIPKGTCVIKHLGGTIIGIDGAAGNSVPFILYFAKPLNGVAPPTFGVPHAATSAAITAPFRRHVITHQYVSTTELDDADFLVGYHVLGSRGEVINELDVLLQGDTSPYPGTTAGYQTIFVAAKVGGAMDFGTEVDLDMAGHQAASTAAVQITTSGTDPRLVFAPGDLIQGHTGTVTAEVVSVDSNVLMTVKNVSAQIDHQEHLILQNPIVLNLGLEY